MSVTNFTPEQTAFITAVQNQTSNLILDAVAGSGKTTTMVAAAQRIPASTRVLAVAFNKRIADTLATRMPPNVTNKTFNALGHGAWQKRIGKRLRLDTRKMSGIVANMLRQGELNSDLWPEVVAIGKLATVAKETGIVPSSILETRKAKPLMADSLENWQWLAAHRDIKWSIELYEAARLTLIKSIEESFAGNIDFADQLYMSVCFAGTFARFDLVIVDEAQDLSPIQHEMIRRSMSIRARLIAVGDPNQAIYAFRGASCNSMEQLQTEFSCTPFPLTFCFRCPASIVESAQQFVPHIQHPADAPAGIATELDSPWAIAQILDPAGTAILCRNVAPLMKIAMKILSTGTPVTVLGRDIGAGLKFTIQAIAGSSGRGKKKTLNSIPIGEFWPRLSKWADQEIQLAKSRNDTGKIAQIEDRAEAIQAIHAGAPSSINSSDDLIQAIDDLFSDNENVPIVCSTIHKSKGLEWSTVVHLDPWRIPSKFAHTPEAIQQEQNLAYVATTRALNRLFWANTDDFTPATGA